MGGTEQRSWRTLWREPPAKLFRAVSFGLVLGVALGSFTSLPWYGWVAGALIAVGFGWRRPAWTSLVLLGLAAAWLRLSAVPPLPPANVLLGQQSFSASVVEAPRASDTVVRYVVETTAAGQPVRVALVAKPYPSYQYGDRLQVQCKQVEPVTVSYLLNQRTVRECAFPTLQYLGSSWSVPRQLFSWRAAAGDRLRQTLAEPYASLTTGMLWGDDAGIPKTLADDFRRTGVSHLLAVSGYNVMVLTEILFWVLVGCGLWRRTASAAVLALVAAFIFFTGAEPAVVRAGLMGSLVIVARLMARAPDKVNLLLGAGAAMLVVSPQLVSNLGFQLSFAAMAGLLFVAPVLERQLSFLPETVGLREAVAQTLAAIAVTLPIILWQVDQLSLVSPLANVLVGPVVVFVFALGLPLVAVSFLGPIATPLAWALSFVMAYVVGVVQWLARLPWAAVHGSVWAWTAVAVLYVGCLGWFAGRKFKWV